MVQLGFVPRDVEELKNLLHHVLRLQHKFFVVHHHAAVFADLLALVVHGGDGLVPLRHALSVVGEIEAGDGDFSGDDRMNGGATVANHEEEFRLKNEFKIEL